MRHRALKIFPAGQRRAAFTLIELLAVVAIFGLMAAMIVPNMNLLQARRLRDAAQTIADRLEFARLRTIVTGKPHRLHIDLDESSYRLEWSATVVKPAEPEAAAGNGVIGGSASTLSLAPPRDEIASFGPMEGVYGIRKLLDPGIYFARVETDQGNTVQGFTSVEFERDGTTDGAVIVLENDDGAALVIEVAPLADAVRIFDAAS